jgi:DNA ligase-1
MLGKTFKGLTDALLEWQTGKLLELEVRRDSYTVYVRPSLVVEIAFDGVQRSTRYPGGLALRFARVLRYREDKTAAEADTIDTVRTLGGALSPGDLQVYVRPARWSFRTEPQYSTRHTGTGGA